MSMPPDLGVIPDDLPGAELVKPGLADIARGRLTAEALLLMSATQRLADSGIHVPVWLMTPSVRKMSCSNGRIRRPPTRATTPCDAGS